jgi:NAD(P)-dependent dehydrogenase (short-subunit alcohol dehydrogenase family)
MSERRTVVVIGGTSGIGRAIALRFSRDGAKLVIAGRDGQRGAAVAAACREEGAGAALFVAVDIADEVSVAALAARIVEDFGAPHVVVNCAGILQSGKRVLDQQLDEDERLWRVNYRGTLLGCQVFGRLMAQAGRGAILNVGSLASFAPLSLPAYTPGKHAVLALTSILAAELGPRGVRVNAVAPGYTLSDGLKAKIANGERNPDAIIETTALRRFVEPDDVAEAAAFLCSDLAACITGVTLPVDAGWLVQAPYAQYLRGNPIKAPAEKHAPTRRTGENR